MALASTDATIGLVRGWLLGMAGGLDGTLGSLCSDAVVVTTTAEGGATSAVVEDARSPRKAPSPTMTSATAAPPPRRTRLSTPALVGTGGGIDDALTV
jgi:hypothetical protein